jgi:uncharacterized RDD family membrane protein YckC
VFVAHLKVHTAQNVELEFPVGNIGQRLLSAFIDLVVVIVYYFIANWIYGAMFGLGPFDKPNLIAILCLFILPISLYLPACEFLWKGQTVGKAVMRMRVVRIDGSSPSLGDIILRWLLRTIDVKLGFLFIFFIPSNPTTDAQQFFYGLAVFFMVMPIPVIGIVSMATSPIAQRLGDRIAGTVVIKSKRTFSLNDTILKATESDYEVSYPNVMKLSDRDIHIIKAAVDQADKYKDYVNVGVLAAKAKKILEVTDDSRPYVFLKTLVKDYNHLAKGNDHR